MYMALRLRRGTDAERLLITPVEGELIYTTDTKLLYVGDGSTAGGIAVDTGGTAIDSLVEDTTPQLGGNLDLNSNNITGTGDVSITGLVSATTLRTSEEKLALGADAGLTNQGIDSIAVGPYSGSLNQSIESVGVGYGAGYNSQGIHATAVGHLAAVISQGAEAVAVGKSAGNNTQGTGAIAIGRSAGTTTQGQDAVALGYRAGNANQGTKAVAIGFEAGETNQAANSIVINASNSQLENTTANSLVIKPIRNAVGTTLLMYDATSGEITHTESPVITGDLTGSVFSDDSSPMVDALNRTMFSDIMTLSPLTAAPVNPTSGMVAAADGTTWDPASKSGAVSYPVFYDGVAWNALY